MKHFLKICCLLIILFSFQSCKKENSNVPSNQSSALQSQNKTDESVLSRINVHANGYLVFSNRNDLMEYGKLMNSPAKVSAVNDLRSRGFMQNAISVMSKDDDDPYATVFDQDGLLQVGDILMKISSDKKFFYIVKEQNLDPEVYAKLIAEFYDEVKMDKINVDRINEEFDMFALIDYTPFGINEPEIAVAQKRPCIGTVHGTACNSIPDVYGGCTTFCCAYATSYFLWINTGTTWGDCTTSTCN